MRFTDAALTATAASNLPTAPSGLTATAASSSQINLSWTDTAGDETGFQIDQATNSTFTTGLTTVSVGAGVTTYGATGLSAGTTYYYRVRATNAVGNSANTSTASATTQSALPTAPSGLTATAVSPSQIDLSWIGADDGTISQIDQATNSTFTTGLTTVTVGADVTSVQRHRTVERYHVLLPCAGRQFLRRFGQLIHGQRPEPASLVRRLPFPCPMAVLLRIRPPTLLPRVTVTGGGLSHRP